MKKYKLGYTQGTYDMFHIGHLNLLRNARAHCEKLIVGINSDALVMQYKNKKPVIDESDRVAIVRELRCVDDVIICETLKKTEIWEKIHFNAVFIGDDWKGNPRWIETEKELAKYNAKVVFIPYTQGISSSIVRAERERENKNDKENN